jgi:two-component system OmpR family response regulator
LFGKRLFAVAPVRLGVCSLCTVTHLCAVEQRVLAWWYPQHSCRGSTNIEPRRILIVEDNDDLRESLATWLALDGAVVDQAHSVATAREALVRKPSVVLLDVHLDDEHSYELAAEVLAADVPPAVVVMSGAATDLDRRRFEALGICAYLSKPFFLDDLARVVATAEGR